MALLLAALGPIPANATEPSTVTLTASPDFVVQERGGAVTVVATLDQPAPVDGVTVTLKAGTAFGFPATSDDYSLPGPFTIAEGETSASAEVTIVDDKVDEEGPFEFLTITADAGGLAVTDVTIWIHDDDRAAFWWAKSRLKWAENRTRVGNTISYSVRMESQPTADVTVRAVSSARDKATVKPASVTFTPDDWNNLKTFTVTGVGVGDSTISHGVETTDSKYSGMSLDSVPITVLVSQKFQYRLEAIRPAKEGGDAAFWVRLNRPRPQNYDLSFAVSYDFSGGSATAADLRSPPSTYIMPPRDALRGVLLIPTAADDLEEGDETFKVTIAATTPGWTEQSDGAATATMTIEDGDKIAFGDSADATAKYTATVNEDVSGGSLNVPVTVSRPPHTTTTFAVEVVRGGTATAYQDTANPGDYRIAVESVTFRPTDGNTKNLVIAIEDDDEVEENETIELRIAAADDPVNDAGDLYKRDESGSTATITIVSEDAAPQPQQRTEPLTASFERAPSEHDGEEMFWFNVRFSEALGADGTAPAAASFKVTSGRVKRVRQLTDRLWRVRIVPKSWRVVTVTLAGGRDCDAEGAVCTADGRALSNTVSAIFGNPVRIRIEKGYAREGRDPNLEFAVTLNRAASAAVSVDYATADGTATAGADYTEVSGTLTFAPGETEKTVSVPIIDDAIDEGRETFFLQLSNPQGAYLRNIHRRAVGIIRNDDPLQAMWLSRFGRTVAADAVAAVTARFETPRDAGSHVTLRGQRLDLSQAEGGKALAGALTGLARAFGAREAPEADDTGSGSPGSWSGAGGAGDPFALTRDPSAATTADAPSGRELLLGTSFRAVLASGAGMQLTSWGQGASVSRFSADVPGFDLSGETATGVMGMDYERGRLLTGFAMMHSVGEGTARDAGWRYAMGSTVTTVLPYARYALSDRVSAWGMAGTGSGRMTLDLDGAVSQRYGADLSMTLAAAGARGDLVTPAEAGGFALALKADAFWVRAESDRVSASEFGSLMGARGESSRMRAVLDGSRTFALTSGATLSPSVELGLRQDGGDAETGTGVEFGAGLGYADPSRGLDMALKVHGLAVHAEDGYDEWGVSGQLRLVPGGSGRGLSASLTPSWGADPQGSERLWAVPDASGLAANDAAPMSSRLDTEVGYGMALFGDRFTGTPNAGFGLSDTAREYRMGWRLTSAVRGDPGFEIDLDATRREAANANQPPEHGVMLRSLIRW